MIGNSSFLVCLASLFYFCLLVAPINFLSNSSFLFLIFISCFFQLPFCSCSTTTAGGREERGKNQVHHILFCCCFLRSLSGSVRCFFSFSHFVCFMKLMLENRTQLVGILYLFIYCCCCCSSNRKRVRRTWVANIYVCILCVCVCVCALARVSRAMAHECRL